MAARPATDRRVVTKNWSSHALSDRASFVEPSDSAPHPETRISIRRANAFYSRPKARRWQRATICVSSQVGCAVECAFCMTALLGLHRNLTAGEIVGQILTVLSDQQVEISATASTWSSWDRANLS